MKKLSLLSLGLLTPLLAFGMTGNFAGNLEISAAGNISCAQVIQPAINAKGECKEFSTPCEVPADWKKVNSCADFQTETKNPNFDKANNRRYQSKWAKLREISKITRHKRGAQTAREHKFLRKSRSFFKRNLRKPVQKYDRVRGTSQKKWGSKFAKYLTPLQKKALEARMKKQSEARKAIERNLHHKLAGTAHLTRKLHQTDKKKLSTNFWSIAQKAREKRFKRFTQNSDIIKKALRSRQPFRKAKPKPQPLKRHVQLRKIYKGGSLRGNLSGSAEVK